MFSSEAATTPLWARTPGIAAGTALMVAVAAAMVSAKTLPFLFGVVFVCFLVAAAMGGRLPLALPRLTYASGFLGVFLAYAAISSTWAVEPGAALLTLTYVMAVAAASVAMLQIAGTEPRPSLLHVGEGMWLGFALALAYLAIELATGQAIKGAIYNLMELQPDQLAHPEYFEWSNGRIAYIAREDLTRNMAPLVLFLWPVAGAVMGSVTRRYASMVAAVLVVASLIVVMTAWHETSKLAILAALVVFIAARYAPRAVGRLLQAGWVLACLGVLPAVLLTASLGLDKASWMQESARHRIIIWHKTAERALETPVFGIGARSTYFLGPQLEKAAAPVPGESRLATLSTHAHNVFLQTWFELGLVGALLLAAFGVALLQVIIGLAPVARPYALTTFASAAVMAASSYGLWQYWFVAMFGLTTVSCGVAARLLATADAQRAPEGRGRGATSP